MSASFAVVGCFTSPERDARGRGIGVHELGRWEQVSAIETPANPSFLCADPSRGLVFAAHGDSEIVSSYRVDPETGAITALGQAASGGRNGVRLVLHPSGRFVFVANYATGAVTTVPVAPDGSLSDATSRLELTGEHGPHREQEASHPHDVVMDPTGRYLVVVDKGLDAVFVARPDPETGELTIVGDARLRAGSGPRHVAFHPVLPRAYVVSELDSCLTSLDWDPASGRLAPRHVVPALPSDFFAKSTAAEVVVGPTGGFAYVSHRGADCIARIALDETGEPTVLDWTPSGGPVPRYMTFSPHGERLVVANEQGDTIVEFAVEAGSGALTRLTSVAALSPSAIVFL